MAEDLSIAKGQVIEIDGNLFRSQKNLGSGFTVDSLPLASPDIFVNLGSLEEAVGGHGGFIEGGNIFNNPGTNPDTINAIKSRSILTGQTQIAPQQEQGTGAVDPIVANQVNPAGEAPQTQAAVAGEQSNLISFAGSPDVFDSATGQRLTEEEVLARGGFQQVEQLNQIRPGITNEEQFAQMAGQPLTQDELQALSQTGEGADQMSQTGDLAAGQGADVPPQAPQAAQAGDTATQQGALTNEGVFKQRNEQGFFDVFDKATGEKLSLQQFQEAGLNIDLIQGRTQAEQGGQQYVKQLNSQGFYDVYNAQTGEKISQEEFQAQGLNIDHLPQMQTETEAETKNVTGQDAVDYYNSLEQMVADRLGEDDVEAEIDEAREDIRTFFDTRKTATQILQEEFAERGIEEKTSLLNDLDARIREQEDLLDDLPEDIQATLEGAGVTQSQLNRIILKESKEPMELLNDLLKERNALASEINQAMSFAERFAQSRMNDQAVRLSALEWELDNAEGDFADIEDEKKVMMQMALDERKSVMELALSYPSAGIDTYEDSLEEAIKKATAVQGNGEFTTRQVGGFEVLFDEQGNRVTQRSLGTRGGSGGGGSGSGGGVTQNQAEQNLLNVGLSVGLMNQGGSLSKGSRTKIIEAGVPPSVTDFIWESITAGKSLDQIRQELTEAQREAGSPSPQEAAFGSLDLFMQTLQEGSSNEVQGPVNPYSTG